MTWYALSSSNSARQTWRSGLMTTATDGSRSVRIWRRTRHRWRQGTTTSWREVRGGRCGGGACIVHMATCSWESSDCEKVVGHLVITVDCTSSWSGSGRTSPLTRSVIDLLFLLPWVECYEKKNFFMLFSSPKSKVTIVFVLFLKVCRKKFMLNEINICIKSFKWTKFFTFVSKFYSQPNVLCLHQIFHRQQNIAVFALVLFLSKNCSANFLIVH